MSGISFSVIRHPRYKYKLDQAYEINLHHCALDDMAQVEDGWARLRRGNLFIARGYCWDGASGPAIDTMSFARASLVHDVLYQLIAADLISKKPWKLHADRELVRIAAEDGMGWLRQKWVYAAVRMFGGADTKYRMRDE